eukprot:880128-Karenia_brevis.AAC.1
MATRVQSYDHSTERWAGARLSLKLRRGLREVAVAPGRGKGLRPSRKKRKATEVIAGIALTGQLARTLHR